MLSLSESQEVMVTATAFLVAFAAFLRTVLPIGKKLDEALGTLRSLNHQWETNGKTGLRDTITLMLEKLDSIEERLARGDQRFDDIEHGQAEAAERGEAIKASMDALRRDVEGRM